MESERALGRRERSSANPGWLNLLTVLLARHYPASREDILSQVSDYKDDWIGSDPKSRRSVRRKFGR